MEVGRGVRLGRVVTLPDTIVACMHLRSTSTLYLIASPLPPVDTVPVLVANAVE